MKRNLTFIVCFIFLPGWFSILGDTITFTNGIVLLDVKSRSHPEKLEIRFKSGRKKFFQWDEVKEARMQMTSWEIPDKIKNPKKKKLHPVVKSALVPGWGQHTVKSYGRGYSYFGSGLLLFYGYYLNRLEYQSRRTVYLDNTFAFTLAGILTTINVSNTDEAVQYTILGLAISRQYYQPLRNSARSYAELGNIFLGVLGTLWAWQVYELAYHEHYLKNKKRWFPLFKFYASTDSEGKKDRGLTLAVTVRF